MAQKPPANKAATREDRLKAALKANMGRRKAQARARAAGTDAKQDGAAPNEAQSKDDSNG